MRVGVVLLAVLAVFVVLPSPLGVCAKRGRRGAWEDAEPEEGGVGMPEKLSSLNINDLTKLRMKELRALLRSWGVECEECTSQKEFLVKAMKYIAEGKIDHARLDDAIPKLPGGHLHNKEEKKKKKRKRDEDMDPSDFKDALDEEAAAEKLAKAKRDGERIKMLNRDINFLRDRTQAEDLEDEDKVHRDHEEHMEHVRHHRARMDEFSRQVDEEIKVVHEHARRNKDNYRFARDRHDRARNFEAEKEIDKVMRELKEQMARENSKQSSGSKSRRRKTSRDEL